MSPSNDHGFPGMEHTRTGDVLPNAGYTDPKPSGPTGPSKDDRRRALELAIEAIRGRNFNTPGGSALAIAKDFAQYLHDGTTDQS